MGTTTSHVHQGEERKQTERHVNKRFVPILQELSKGSSNRHIAAATGLTVHTVEKYVSDLLTMFDCAGRGELIVILAQGLVNFETGEVSR